MDKEKMQLVLNKGSEKYIFRYDNGSEAQLLDSMVQQAQDQRTDFDRNSGSQLDLVRPIGFERHIDV